MTDATPTDDSPKSPYEVLGDAGVRQVVERFYALMDELPEAAGIRAMHGDDLTLMVDKLTVFLIGWMGGPRNYNERFGRVVIPVAHRPFAIGPALRERIMDSMMQMAEMCRTREADGSERSSGLPPHLAR